MICVITYFMAIVAANLSIAHFGPSSAPINALLFIGLDFVLRDKLHDRWQGRNLAPKMLALIVGAGWVSYFLNPAAGAIAFASMTAFIIANLADAGVYGMLRNKPFLLRSNASNVTAAAVDSLIFPTLAFGVLMPHIILAQFAAKVLGGFLWSAVIARFKS